MLKSALIQNLRRKSKCIYVGNIIALNVAEYGADCLRINLGNFPPTFKVSVKASDVFLAVESTKPKIYSICPNI